MAEDWSYRMFASPEEASRWMAGFIAQRERARAQRRAEIRARVEVGAAIALAVGLLVFFGGPEMGWW